MVAQSERNENVQVLKKPAAGEIQVQAIGSELDVSFDFDLNAVQATEEGENLILTFEDGAVLKLTGFVNELEPVDVVLQDGTVLSAEAIMAAIGDDGFIDTAAGSTAANAAPQNSGSPEYDGNGNLIDGIDNYEGAYSFDASSGARTLSANANDAGSNDPVAAFGRALGVDAEPLVDILAGANDPAISGSLLGNVRNSDGDALTFSAPGAVAKYGTFTLNPDGTWTYTLDNQNGDVVALDDGESFTETFTYTVSDGSTTSTATMTVTVNGTNDAPTVVADTGTVTASEYHDVADLTVVPKNATGNVLENDSDLDIENITVQNPGSQKGLYGTVTINEDGSYTYVLDHTDTKVQALSEGSTPLTDKFTYNATDGDASTSSELVISVHGTNDRPEVLVDNASRLVTESGDKVDAGGNVVPDTHPSSVSGQVSFTDVDSIHDGNGEVTGSGTLTYTLAHTSARGTDDAGPLVDSSSTGKLTLQGKYGQLEYDTADGTWKYDLDNDDTDTQGLSAGTPPVAETFTITASDGSLSSVPHTITVNVQGTNDAPEVSAATNVDTGADSYVGAGAITASVSEHGFVADSAQSSIISEYVAKYEEYERGVADGKVVEPPTPLDPDIASSSEEFAGDPTASGTLTFKDIDSDNHGNDGTDTDGVGLKYSVSVAEVAIDDVNSPSTIQEGDTGSLTIQGKYGELVYDTDNGTWTYELDNKDPDTQALGNVTQDEDGNWVNTSLTGEEVFTVTAEDNSGATVSQQIKIDVEGSFDPVEFTLDYGEYSTTKGAESNRAGWNNSVGYTVTYADGTTSSHIAWSDAHHSEHTTDSVAKFIITKPYTDVEFFVIPNGGTYLNTDTKIYVDEANDKLQYQLPNGSWVSKGFKDGRVSTESGDHADTAKDGAGADVHYDPATGKTTYNFEDYPQETSNAKPNSTSNNHGDVNFTVSTHVLTEQEYIDPQTGAIVFTIKGDVAGKAAADELHGTHYDDVITGGGGDDILTGNGGTNILLGGDGNDTFMGGEGDDHFYGGDKNADSGNDTVSYENSLESVKVDLKYQWKNENDAENDELNGIENLRGTAHNDFLYGSDVANRIDGGSGNDTIAGRDGNDVVFGDKGDDVIYGGSEGNTPTTSGGGSDELHGGRGADSIFGGGGNDTLYGDSGNDTLLGGRGADIIDGGSGNDFIQGGINASEFNHLTNLPTETLSGGAGNDIIFGERFFKSNDGHNTVKSGREAAQVLEEVQKLQRTDVKAAGDLLANSVNNSERDGSDGDIIDGGADNDIIMAGDGRDIVTGGSGSDYITGDNGNDLIQGGDGVDFLYGGGAVSSYESDNDVIFGGKLDASITTLKTEVASLHEADSIADVAQIGESLAQYLGTDDNSVDTVVGGHGHDYINTGGGNDVIDSGTGNDFIVAGAGDDEITVSSDSYAYNRTNGNIVQGGAGSDTITAGDGDDIIFGGTSGSTAAQLTDALDALSTGAKSAVEIGKELSALVDHDNTADGVDEIISGKGDDVIITGNANDVVHAGEGDDYINGGAGNDILYGQEGSDYFVGGTGADEFHGGNDAGVDTVSYETVSSSITATITGKGVGTASGNADALGDSYDGIERIIASEQGNDILIIDQAGNFYVDVTIEDGKECIKVYLGNFAHPRNLIMTGIDFEHVKFTQADDVVVKFASDAPHVEVTGSSNVNIIEIVGHDTNSTTVNAGAESDVMFASAVHENFNGEDGIDTVSHARSSSAVTIDLNTPANNTGDASGDTYQSIEAFEGSRYADTLVENADAHHFDGGRGIDTVSYAGSEAVKVNLSNSVVDGVVAGKGEGGNADGDSYDGIENVIGSDHADIITGNSASNRIEGGKGADVINGGAGNDVLIGGDGAEGGNLIENGSFEQWTANTHHRNSTPDDWNVKDAAGQKYHGIDGHQNGYVEVQSSSITPDDNYGTGISQTIETVEGQTYVLNFMIQAGNSDEQHEGITAHILNSDVEIVSKGFSADGAAWQEVSVEFTAQSDSTTIAFDQNAAQAGSNKHWGINLDNVSVVAKDDTISGGLGNDEIHGNAGNDILYGNGAGKDVPLTAGQEDNDHIYGESGNDIIYGNAGDDHLYGGTNTSESVNLINDGMFSSLSSAPRGTHDWAVDVKANIHSENGETYVEIDDYHRSEWIQQTIDTKDGEIYTLNFDAWNLEGSDGIKVDIIHGDKSVSTEVFTGAEINAFADRSEAFTFEAKGDHTSIRFYQDDGSNGDYVGGDNPYKGIYLNNISVVKADGDYLDGGLGDDILNGGAGDRDILNGGAGEDTFLFKSEDFSLTNGHSQTTIIKDFNVGEDQLKFSDVISGDTAESYTMTHFDEAGGNTTITVEAKDATGQTVAHEIVLNNINHETFSSISGANGIIDSTQEMSAVLQALINNGS